ncbi:MAG: Dam family site-specific DNA-(adenine-N6)-methyltransferase [Clostridia bacterium]|nr:Dam family site-specific DNA-(adenine-N6)-methyltransferase [Clostridia bacterium]
MKKVVAKPFLKWAGGKGQLLNNFKELYPQKLIDGKIETYIEPFVGGGAVLFDILQNYKIKKVYINDINRELINCYHCIKINVEKIISQLNIMENEYLSSEDRSKYFYKVRNRYNEIQLKKYCDFEKCVDFIFLNKTCFNGLYRVNKDGKFNVPHGKYKKPLICNYDNLRLCSNLLQKVEINSGNYEQILDKADKNTFIYFDPPYRPLIEKNSFVSYDKSGFNDDDQIKLAENYKLLDRKGCLLLLSNSDPKNTNEEDSFFDDIYKGFKIERVFAKRMINCEASKRGDITEIVVMNYKGEKMKRDFDEWFSNFTDSIATYEYYTDFCIVYKNIDKIKVELNIMNSLIGSKNIEYDFNNLFKKYPEIRKCLPLLIAVREKEIKVIDDGEKLKYNFTNIDDIELLKRFMKKTGLFDLISNHLINNLVDYATGIEVGLGSNGRKNRGGHLMEDILQGFIEQTGFEKNKNYFKEMYLKEIEEKWNIDLSKLSNLGKVAKRFDYVVKTNNCIYAFETNFYSSNGSKLNETARSYKMLAEESRNIDGFVFVWVTDGFGWKSAKHNLEETFDVMENIYNINDLENGKLKELLK